MADPIAFRPGDDTRQGLTEVQRKYGYSDVSDAARKTMREGLEAMGIRNGKHRDTPLRQGIRRVADATAMLALLWLGATFLAPIGFRAWVIPIALVSISMYASDRVLARVEPSVSRRLRLSRSRGEQA